MCDPNLDSSEVKQSDISENGELDLSTLCPPSPPRVNSTTEDRDIQAYVISNDIVKYHLQVMGKVWRDAPTLPAPNRVRLMLRVLVDEFLSRYNDKFGDEITKMKLDRSTAAPQFAKICDSLFEGKISWGRIVGLLAFSTVVTKYCVEKGLGDLVPSIPQWTGYFIVSRLKSWILQHGGWEGMVEYFENGGRNGMAVNSLSATTYKTIAFAAGVIGVIWAVKFVNAKGS